MGYCKFIEIGIDRQNDSVTIDEATRNYARSCEACAKKGYNFRYDCEVDCPITVAHREKIEAIITLRQIEHERAMKKQKERETEKIEALKKAVEDIYLQVKCVQDLLTYESELENITDRYLQLKGNKRN